MSLCSIFSLFVVLYKTRHMYNQHTGNILVLQTFSYRPIYFRYFPHSSLQWCFYPKFGAEYRHLHNPKKNDKIHTKIRKMPNSSDLALWLIVDFYELRAHYGRIIRNIQVTKLYFVIILFVFNKESILPDHYISEWRM